MREFSAGEFYGRNTLLRESGGLKAIETIYNYTSVDWHRHDHPYFLLVINGKCRHINRRSSFDCGPGSLYFHNRDEPHRNTREPGISRAFQLDVSPEWCERNGVELDRLPGSIEITQPDARVGFHSLFMETRFADGLNGATVESETAMIFQAISGRRRKNRPGTPRWVRRVEEILRSAPERDCSLAELADELGLHFAHLSRDFRYYFGCSFGSYIRKIKVERALTLIRRRDLSLTDVAHMSGFSDQSHFIRCFREFNGVTPGKFRELVG